MFFIRFGRASLWYVSLMIASPHSVTLVPPVKYKTPDAESKGRKRYEIQKASRDQASDNLNVSDCHAILCFFFINKIRIKLFKFN